MTAGHTLDQVYGRPILLTSPPLLVFQEEHEQTSGMCPQGRDPDLLKSSDSSEKKKEQGEAVQIFELRLDKQTGNSFSCSQIVG